jgi:hypothetical protein
MQIGKTLFAKVWVVNAGNRVGKRIGRRKRGSVESAPQFHNIHDFTVDQFGRVASED